MSKPDKSRIAESKMRMLERHHKGHMDDGGSHATYCSNNLLTEAQGEHLINKYLKEKGKK